MILSYERFRSCGADSAPALIRLKRNSVYFHFQRYIRVSEYISPPAVGLHTTIATTKLCSFAHTLGTCSNDSTRENKLKQLQAMSIAAAKGIGGHDYKRSFIAMVTLAEFLVTVFLNILRGQRNTNV